MPSAAMESARCSASIAHLVVPAPGCGRARNAASPSSATRPNTICGEMKSKIAWKNGRGSRSKISATCGATSARACALLQAMTSGRSSGGGIEVPWHLPLASVQKSASFSGVVGRYQTML